MSNKKISEIYKRAAELVAREGEDACCGCCVAIARAGQTKRYADGVYQARELFRLIENLGPNPAL